MAGNRSEPMHGQMFFRNAFSADQQEVVREATFALIGLGGTGGFMLENLLRMGAERFVVFDHDRFELSNFNRQLLATRSSLDWQKTEAALARAREINPAVRMSLRGGFGPRSSVAGASAILDGSDNVEARLAASRLAGKKRIPYVFCSASGSRGMVSVFRGYGFRRAFQMRGSAPVRARRPVLCPAAALAGTLAASQAVNCLLGRPFVRAPDALSFDVFSKRVFWRVKLG